MGQTECGSKRHKNVLNDRLVTIVVPLRRIMGSLCAVMGVVMVALPISVISSTFNEKFREHNQGIQVRARRAEQKRALTSKLRAMFFSTQGRGWGSNEVLSNTSKCLRVLVVISLHLHTVDTACEDMSTLRLRMLSLTLLIPAMVHRE